MAPFFLISPTKTLWTDFLPHECHKLRPSHIPWSHHLNNVWRRINIKNLFLMHCYPAPCYVLLLRPIHFPRNHSANFFPLMWGIKLYTHTHTHTPHTHTHTLTHTHTPHSHHTHTHTRTYTHSHTYTPICRSDASDLSCEEDDLDTLVSLGAGFHIKLF